MHSRAGLTVLTLASALAVLAVVLDVTMESSERPRSRRVLPDDSTLGQVVGLTWQRAHTAPFAVVRADGDRFAVDPGAATDADAGRAVLDQMAVRAVIETLAIMTYAQRRSLARAERQTLGLDASATTVRVDFASGRRLLLTLGNRIVETDRVWLTRRWLAADDRAGASADEPEYAPVFLIDGYLARAVDRRPRDLRKRQVFAVFHQDIERIDMSRNSARLHIAGRPGQVQVGPGPDDLMAADPQRVRALATALAEITIDRFTTPGTEPGPSVEPPLTVTIEMSAESGGHTTTLRTLGPCPAPQSQAGATGPDMQLCATSIGRGCIATGSLAGLAEYLERPTAMVASTALAGLRPLTVTLSQPDGPSTRVRGTGRSWAWADSSAGPELEVSEVESWLGHLERARADVIIWPDERTVAAADRLADDFGLPRLTVEFTRPDGALASVRIYRNLAGSGIGGSGTGDSPAFLLRRDHEPGFLALPAGPHLQALWPVTPGRFQRRQLLNREPFALRSVTVERAGQVATRLERGQLLDDWRVQIPDGQRVAPEVIDGVRELARLRARTFASDQPRAVHGLNPPRVHIQLTFDPSPFPEPTNPGEPDEYVIAIGTSTPDGCYARLDGKGPVFIMNQEDCSLLTGPLTQPLTAPP